MGNDFAIRGNVRLVLRDEWIVSSKEGSLCSGSTSYFATRAVCEERVLLKAVQFFFVHRAL